MRSLNSSYLPAVDHIRAFAATLVLFQHSFAFIGGRVMHGDNILLRVSPASNVLEAVVIEGHTGVALFMVLSGFIFTHIAYGREIRYGSFLLNRVLRIYPLMIALIIAAYVFKHPDVRPTAFLSVVAIPLQFMQPVDLWFVPHIHPYTSLFWTIAPEFQFYLLFPLILSLVYARGPKILIGIIACAIALRAVLVSMGAPAQDLSYLTLFGRIDQFLVGMGVAVVWRGFSDRRLEFLCLLSLGVMPFVLFLFNRLGGVGDQSAWKILWPTIEGLIWGAFILGYLQFALRLPGWLSRGLAKVGEVSFSMYLLHVAVISVALKLGPMTFGFGPFGAAFLNGLLIVLPGTIAISWISYRVIELPFLRLRVRYLGDPIAEATRAPERSMPVKAAE